MMCNDKEISGRPAGSVHDKREVARHSNWLTKGDLNGKWMEENV